MIPNDMGSPFALAAVTDAGSLGAPYRQRARVDLAHHTRDQRVLPAVERLELRGERRRVAWVPVPGPDPVELRGPPGVVAPAVRAQSPGRERGHERPARAPGLRHPRPHLPS